jgi:hypothetical protein
VSSHLRVGHDDGLCLAVRQAITPWRKILNIPYDSIKVGISNKIHKMIKF